MAAVRIPMPVEAAEARGGERLVHGRVVLEPRIALGYRARKLRQLLGKARRHEACVPRAAAMVNEPGDGVDAELAQATQALVWPAPVGARRAVGRDALPEYGIAQLAHAQLGDAFQVIDALGVTAALHLAEVLVADAVDGAFDAAPQLQRFHTRASPLAEAR